MLTSFQPLSVRPTKREPVNLLFIDDFIPDPTIGAGAPRAFEFLRSLTAAGATVTLFSAAQERVDASFIFSLPHGVSVVEAGVELNHYLTECRGKFGGVIVSRPHNMALFRQAWARAAPAIKGAAVIYDAEALFATRKILFNQLFDSPLTADEAERLIEAELKLAEGAHVVLAVNEQTAEAFRQAGHLDVRVLGHALSIRPSPRGFSSRDGFLFVGPTYEDHAPNSDAVVWFVDRVLPLIREKLGRAVSLMLVGTVRSQLVAERKCKGLTALGALPDLTEVYSRARVFVAPLRYASGLPFKVYEAAAHGVPIVLTPLLAGQLGWSGGQEVLVAESPEDFAEACVKLHTDKKLWKRLRSRALGRVRRDCSRRNFDRTVSELLSNCIVQGSFRGG